MVACVVEQSVVSRMQEERDTGLKISCRISCVCTFLNKTLLWTSQMQLGRLSNGLFHQAAGFEEPSSNQPSGERRSRNISLWCHIYSRKRFEDFLLMPIQMGRQRYHVKGLTIRPAQRLEFAVEEADTRKKTARNLCV